jgi:phosphate-selective porin OprO/OprP
MKFSTGALIGASWLALSGAAMAQETPDAREARIQELEQRLADIETQLQDLKASTSADVVEVRRVAAEQPIVTIANGRPTITSPDGNFRFAFRGLFQFDAANYLQDDDLSASASVQDLSSGANFRRARLGIEGTAFRDWNYALTYEAGGSGIEASGLQQAWVEYAGWKPFGLTAPVRFRAGAFAVENTLEGATNNTDSLFLERPAVAELVRSQFGGDGRNAFGVYANGDRLSLSLIGTGGLLANADVNPNTQGDVTDDIDYIGAGGVNDEGWGYVARAGALVLRGPNSSVHVGANYSAAVQLGDSAIPGVSDAIRLRERPELRVDAQNGTFPNGASSARLVDTGNLSAHSAQAYGVELAGQWGPLFLASEWLQIDVDRPSTVALDPSFSGYYVQGAWTITGERRTWNAVTGGYGGIRPTNNFSIADGHWGAWELAARYSVLNLNDNEGEFGLAPPSGGVRGGEQTISTLGLNWYLNPTIRLLLDLQNVEVDRLNSSGAQIGQDYQAVALRTQVSF